MSSPIEIERHGPVARVYLNRPEVRNAFNDQVITSLAEAFRGFATDNTLRAIVLGGHGKAFCAGADLSWMRAMADYSWEQNRADAQALADMLWAIYSCPVPVVGRIQLNGTPACALHIKASDRPGGYPLERVDNPKEWRRKHS